MTRAELLEFRERERWWLSDWERFAGRGAAADQLRFEREWSALRSYARERGVRLLGDVPIYVAEQSADHLLHPELFQEGAVAGAPPDAYTTRGQLWGNPLYDWPALRRRRYRWWALRLRRTLALFDVARIDHFRGFVAYWAVPASARTAAAGRWRRGPGRAPFDAIQRELALAEPLPFLAEDLGVITPPVDRLRDELGLPGMLVVQFAFEPDEPESVHRLERHVVNRVVYLGTHDHDTARGWYESLDTQRRAMADAAMAQRGIAFRRQPWWGLIRLTLSSPARLAMVQAQDVLGLGSAGRMNQPARASGNWRWQMEPGSLTPSLARRLREAAEESGRLKGATSG